MIAPEMPPRFITTPKDLVTSPQATKDGFLQQVLRKTTEANPHISQALRLQARLQQINNPSSLVNAHDIRDELVASAGFSDKASKYFSDSELKDALRLVLKKIQDDAPTGWRSEIVFRFLLTCGDALGGTMRNIAGALAQVKFTDAVQSALNKEGIRAIVIRSPNNDKVRSLSWPQRILLFDRTPKFIGKNIDVILIRTSAMAASHVQLSSTKSDYVACGELKGGIDPAGADEHWKTASGALARIREKFPERSPKLFFVGAAIEVSMAQEIFAQLQSGQLTHAANLTSSEQVSDLADWLVSL